MDLIPTGAGILTTEAMLRMSQTEIDQLRARLTRADEAVKGLLAEVQVTSVFFCALIVQAGGTATITQEEIKALYSMGRRQDPATHALTFTAEKVENEKLPLVVVQ